MSVSLCQSVSVCVSLCQFVSVCVNLCQSVSVCISLCQSVSVCVSLCQSVSVCVSLCQSVSVCVSLCHCPCHLSHSHSPILPNVRKLLHFNSTILNNIQCQRNTNHPTSPCPRVLSDRSFLTLCHYDWASQMSNSTSWCYRYSLTTSNKIYVGSKASFSQWQSTQINTSSSTHCTTNVSVIHSPCWQKVTTTGLTHLPLPLTSHSLNPK